jgi:hypothetical protein
MLDSNLGAFFGDKSRFQRTDLEVAMAVVSEISRVLIRDRQDSPDINFGVWASVVLLGLAILSIALGIAPVEDPMIFAAP